MQNMEPVDLKPRRGTPIDPPETLKRLRKRSKKKPKAQDAQQAQQAQHKPQQPKGKKVLIGMSVFAAAAGAVGLYHVNSDREPGMGKQQHSRLQSIPPVDPDLEPHDDEWIKVASEEGSKSKASLAAKVFAAYGESGLDTAPQGDCIRALTRLNAGTTSHYTGFGDETALRFDRLAVERKAAEQSAISNDEVDAFFKVDPTYITFDRHLNVRYLDETERAACVITGNERGEVVDPNGMKVSPGRHIFVIGLDGTVYSSPFTELGSLHHSSFLAAEPVIFAGEMVIGEDGKVHEINNRSGHYHPRWTSFRAAARVFEQANIGSSEDLIVERVGPT